jgi:hypothetical protein
MTNEKKPDYSLCPSCPEIKKKIDRIDLALLGEDGTGLNGGIVKAITDLQKKGRVQASWTSFSKPIAIAAISSVITYGLTYVLTH